MSAALINWVTVSVSARICTMPMLAPTERVLAPQTKRKSRIAWRMPSATRVAIEQATRVAEGIRQAIRDFRFVWGASTLSVGASIGIVQIRAETETVTQLMSAADIACYAAKDAGRNRIHVYDADGVSHRHREMQWVSRVTRAAEDNRFELYFQPIVPLGSATGPSFHELTVRMRDDNGELVPPSEFIPAP